MREKPERRHLRRYPIHLPLLHRPKTLKPYRGGIGWTRNLSEVGACVELAERLQSRAPLRLRVQTDRGTIEVEAAVTWSDRVPLSNGGILHGVTFTHLDPEALQALQDLLLSKGLMRPAKVRLPLEVDVTCHLGGQTEISLRGRTRDISRGGLLLRLGQVLPPGTALELTLHTKTWPFTVQGTIVWVAPPEGRTPGGPIGHGLRFNSIGWTSALALARFILERP